MYRLRVFFFVSACLSFRGPLCLRVFSFGGTLALWQRLPKEKKKRKALPGKLALCPRVCVCVSFFPPPSRMKGQSERARQRLPFFLFFSSQGHADGSVGVGQAAPSFSQREVESGAHRLCSPIRRRPYSNIEV